MTDTPRYYLLQDLRVDEQYLTELGQLPSPGRDPRRTYQLVELITAKLKHRYRNWTPGTYCNLDLDGWHAIQFSTGDLPAEVWYECGAPETFEHLDFIAIPGGSLNWVGKYHGTYTCVSKQWADAIAACEPGIHEMHPVKLLFSDGAKIDRIILRTMNVTSVFNFKASSISSEISMCRASPAHRISVFQSALQGKHWVSQHRPGSMEYIYFVSEKLAELLRPLTSECIRLRAVDLT
jgi:hypothetical protein